MRFRYDDPVIRSDTCSLPLPHDLNWLVQERGTDARGQAVNVGDSLRTDRSSEQCVGIGCGCWREHSTEGSETASGVSADLGVDSARRYHMRPVADKPRATSQVTLNKESAREWAEVKASSTSTALQLEEFANEVPESGGKQRVSTKLALIHTEEQDSQEGWMSFTDTLSRQTRRSRCLNACGS